MDIQALRAMKKGIGLGLAALGRPGYINLGHDGDLGADKSVVSLEGRTFDVLDAAWEKGIRYFDAARSYGKAEEFLAAWIISREISKEEIFVASKWGYRYTGNWHVQAKAHEVKEHSLAHLRSQLRESQQILGTHMQLYQIHSATVESGVLEDQDILDELSGLKAKGLAIGLTLSGPRQSETLDQALQIERDGRLLFDAVQATWNLLETTAGPSLEAAHQAGLLVIVKEALANGRLTKNNRDPIDAGRFSGLERLAKRYGVNMDAIALAAVLAQDWVDIVLSGATRVEHLRSNLKALDIEINDLFLSELDGLAEDSEDYWIKRSRMNWN